MPRYSNLYWATDNPDKSPLSYGYVGVSMDLKKRKYHHIHDETIPVKDFEMIVLFRGPENKCYELEKLLRPSLNIGWNHHPGGRLGHAHKNIPKSPEQRAKMRAVALARYTKPGEHERTSRAVKRGLKGVDRTGANNAMFGRTQSEETKQKIRDAIAERGGVSGKNNPNYRHGQCVED
jgi:hypothetical protein